MSIAWACHRRREDVGTNLAATNPLKKKEIHGVVLSFGGIADNADDIPKVASKKGHYHKSHGHVDKVGKRKRCSSFFFIL